MTARPSLRRRRLATALKQLREERGWTMEEAAAQAGEGFSKAKISRVESMASSINGDDTYTLATALGANEATADALVQLARSARRRGWWHLYDHDVLGNFSDFLELEHDAREFLEFQVDVIPGPAQTEDYMTAVFQHFAPDSDVETIKQRVAIRRERQDRMMGRACERWFILDEAALRRPVGGPEVMAAQLDQLERVARQPGVSVQVLPQAGITGHAAMGVPFTLFTLQDGAQYAFVESLTGGLYIEEPADIATYARAWSRLQATSLDFERSIRVIRSIAAEHRRTTNDDV